MPTRYIYNFPLRAQSIGQKSTVTDFPIISRRTEPGQENPRIWHQHDCLEIAVVLSGTAVHILGDQSAPIREGDVLLIGPNLVHGYEECSTLGLYNVLYNITKLPVPILDGEDIPASQRFLPAKFENPPHGYSPSPIAHFPDRDALNQAVCQIDRIHQELRPFSSGELQKYFSLFMDYVLLGGMPAVLRSYLRTKTFESTLTLQRQLLLDYQEDIQKYASGLDQAKILAVFNHIAPQLAKENKKFQLSKVAPGARSREYFGGVQWLLDAGVISICHCLNFPELPLKGNSDMSKYKLYLADTGILIALLDEEAGNDLRQNLNLGVYKGALYENFVAEALTKSGYDLYYYKRDNASLEEDFFVRTATQLIPVEVKAGNNTSKSLRILIDSDRYPEIHEGIKFIHGNIGQANQITTFPYFCSFLLKSYLALHQ